MRVVLVILGAAIGAAAQGRPAAPITIDYPLDTSVFPPEFPPTTFQWRDAAPDATAWRIEVTFRDGSPAFQVISAGERLKVGEIDPRCVAETNELPKLTPEQAAARTWKPEPAVWAAIKQLSVRHPATITIAGLRSGDPAQVVSTGAVRIQTSTDPVAAPIFYRDVPLMPSELEKGVIKPLPANAVPLVAWRLKDVGEPGSRLLLDGLPTCANCHSFSLDGKTMGMDLDGPQNDKGMYAIFPVAPRISIRNEGVISWNALRARPASPMRAGFMSQVSPDGRYVVTSVNGAKKDLGDSYYVANFKDYRFLQVFYPTRGILSGTAVRRAGFSRCRAPVTRALCTPTPSGVPTAAISCSPEPGRESPIPRDRSPLNLPTIRTRPPFSTTCTGYHSMRAVVDGRNRSPELRTTV